MEPEGSIPNSQKLSTCSYPELSTQLRLVPSGFPTNNVYVFLFYPIRATRPAHLILLDWLF
jgi:hypothetical protein